MPLRLASWAFRSAVPPPPGLSMPAVGLEREVVTCEQAAREKGIPLENELKTLVLETSLGLRALHLRGNKKASLRSVKRFLHAEQAHIASSERLDTLRLLPGTVCPLLEPVWSLSHLVSSQVLQLAFVSTNNGTRRGYYRFSPSILLSAKDVSIGEFEM